MIKFVPERVENIVGKGENAFLQHFIFSHTVFYPSIHSVFSIFESLSSFLSAILLGVHESTILSIDIELR